MPEPEVISQAKQQESVFGHPDVLAAQRAKEKAEKEKEKVKDKPPEPTPDPVKDDPPAPEPKPEAQKSPAEPVLPEASTSQVEHLKKQNELLIAQLNKGQPDAVVVDPNKEPVAEPDKDPVPPVDISTKALINDEQWTKVQEGDIDELNAALTRAGNLAAEVAVERVLKGLNNTIDERSAVIVNSRLNVQQELDAFFTANPTLAKYQGMVLQEARSIEAGYKQGNKPYTIRDVLQAAGEVIEPMIAEFDPNKKVDPPATPNVKGGGPIAEPPLVVPDEKSQKQHMDDILPVGTGGRR